MNQPSNPANETTARSSAGLSALYISPEDIQKLPLYRYEGGVEIIQRDEAVESALAALEAEEVLGFDTETQPAFEKGLSFPTALVQLATSRNVYIFQLARLRRLDWLARIMGSAHIVKAGVAVAYDVGKLRELSAFEPAGIVDVAHLAAQAGIKNRGLRGLAALLMGVRVSKGARQSNWARKELSSRQIAYAAADAWLCRELYFRLQKLAVERRAMPIKDGGTA
jgi:ribonuclease D